jgi:Ca-activated chloride channel family protein
MTLHDGNVAMIQVVTRVLSFALVITVAAIASRAQSTETGARRAPVLRNASPVTLEPGNLTTARNKSGGGPTLITIPTIVMDRNGRYIANLRKEDFRIFDGEAEQQVAYFASIENPFTVALMLDMSGSTQYQLAQIRAAAETFVSRLRANDRMITVTFDGKINLLNDIADVRAIRQMKLHFPAVTDGTALYDAVDFTMKRMAQVPGRKAIVLFTDGVDQTSTGATLQSTLQEIGESDVIVYTVQYNTLPQVQQRLISIIKSDKARRKVEGRLTKQYALSEPYLRAMAEKTGGRFYRASDLRDAASAFEAITAELGLQYSLGYYLKDNAPANAERAIRIRVRYPNLVVRARDRYSTPPAIASK